MIRNSILHDEAGLSLIEIVIAAAITLTLVLGISEFLVYVKKDEVRARVKQERFTDDQTRTYQQKTTPPPLPD